MRIKDCTIIIKSNPIASALLIVSTTSVVLKLTGLVDWSWIWVLSPIWLGGGFIVGAGSVIISLVLACALLLSSRKRKKIIDLYAGASQESVIGSVQTEHPDANNERLDT